MGMASISGALVIRFLVAFNLTYIPRVYLVWEDNES